MKKHNTRRALLTSGIALLLCVSMLIGTTFAWFTDSVTSSGNIIKSGNLEITFGWFEGEKDVPTSDSQWKNAESGAIFNYSLWEPGFTQARHIQIKNVGNLALKYAVTIEANGEVSKLADVIDVYYVDPATKIDNRSALSSLQPLCTLSEALAGLELSGRGVLAAEEAFTATLVLKMQESAGNEYKDLSIGSDFSVKVFATQYTAEEDSFGPDYDEESYILPVVTTAGELKGALENGESVKLGNDIAIDETIVIPAAPATMSLRSTTKATVIDLNGKTISIAISGNPAIMNYGNLVVTGNGTIENTISNAIKNAGRLTMKNGKLSAATYALNNLEDGVVVIDGGELKGGIYNLGDVTVNDGYVSQVNSGRHAVYNWSATLTVNGGKFDSISTNELIFADGQDCKVVLNDGEFDKIGKSWLYAAASGKNITFEINGGTHNGYTNLPENTVDAFRPYGDPIVVNGGSFNFDPAKWTAAGYKPEKNENGEWEIEAAIKNAADFQNAIANAKNGEVITLVSDLTVTTPAYGQNAINYDKAANLTIDLNGHTLTADTGNSVVRFNITNAGATSDVTLTIKNGKVIAGSNTWCAVMAAGTSTAKAIMNLENLTVENSKANDMAVKAWDNAVVNATNVTVNATKGAGGFYAVGGEVVLDNCTVNQEGFYSGNFFLSAAVAVSGGGKATVNSGTYSAIYKGANAYGGNGTYYGTGVLTVMSSGGTLIVNGGTFTNGKSEDAAETNLAHGIIVTDAGAKVQINGGTFIALKNTIEINNNTGGKNPEVTLAGGTFNSDPRSVANYGANRVTLADGYAVSENADGTFTVKAN